MGRSPKFTTEQKYEIVEEYLDTPPSWTMTKIARRWGCSQPTIGNIINEIFAELNRKD